MEKRWQKTLGRVVIGASNVEESAAFAPSGPATVRDHACGRAEAPGGSGAAVVQAARALGCRRR